MKKHHSQSGFAHILLVIALVIVIIIVAGIAFTKFKKSHDTAGLGDWTAGCTSKDRVTLTHTPMDFADISTVAPMGLTAGAHVTPIDHLYYYPKGKDRDAAAVYAMADGFIVDISERTQNVDSGTSKAGEFRIVMQHSCQTISYFDLMTSLDPAIMKQWKSSKLGVRIPIKAGQVVGRVGGQSLDTAVYNMDLTLHGFIHPAMYAAEPWKVHTDDFFSYFDEPLRGQFLALNPRKIMPYSGKIDYDQPGKLIGNWFVEGTHGYAGPDPKAKVGSSGHGYWDGHLSIHYAAIDGKSIIVSIGRFGAEGQAQAFAVKDNTPDPATIDTSSGLVKYDLIQTAQGGPSPDGDKQDHNAPPAQVRIMGVALFQVLGGEKLKVEVIPGKTAADVSGFSGSAKTYER